MASGFWKIVGVFAALLFAYVSLKPLIGRGWSSPREPTMFYARSDNGTEHVLVLAPNQQNYALFQDDETAHTEAVKLRLVGSYGTHLFFGVWVIGGKGLLDYRVYEEGIEPVRMEISVERKFTSGADDLVFPPQGTRDSAIWLVAEDRIKMSGVWFDRVETDPDLLTWLHQTLAVADISGSRSQRYFHGYECTKDCSGHEAGYKWAESKGITRLLECTGNSRSFVQGCIAYVER